MILLDGHFYWIHPKTDSGTPSLIMVGQYRERTWTYPTFDLCGTDDLHRADDFDVLAYIEPPKNKEIPT